MNGTQTINGNGFPSINHSRRDHMDKNKRKHKLMQEVFKVLQMTEKIRLKN